MCDSFILAKFGFNSIILAYVSSGMTSLHFRQPLITAQQIYRFGISANMLLSLIQLSNSKLDSAVFSR